MAGYEVSGSSLERIHGQLEGAHNDIDSLAGSIPGTSEAGLLSAPLTAMLADCVGHAAEFSTALKKAASQVVDSKGAYEKAEAEGQREIDHAGGVG